LEPAQPKPVTSDRVTSNRVTSNRVTRIEMVSDEHVLGELEVEYLGRPGRGDAEAESK